MSAATPIGTLTRKSQRHEATERIAAATLGLPAEADRDDHRHVADALSEPRRGIDEADERDIDAHDSGRAEALDQPRDRQRGEVRGERAGERSRGEEGEAGQ